MPRPDHPLITWLRSDASTTQAPRRAVGLGVFFGFFIGVTGYMLTANGWWFLAPFIGFALAWRLYFGRWPFARR